MTDMKRLVEMWLSEILARKLYITVDVKRHFNHCITARPAMPQTIMVRDLGVAAGGPS